MFDRFPSHAFVSSIGNPTTKRVERCRTNRGATLGLCWPIRTQTGQHLDLLVTFCPPWPFQFQDGEYEIINGVLDCTQISPNA